MRKINEKKHDMSMLYEFILLVAVIVIVSIMVFSITEDSREDITISDRTSASVVNETVIATDAGTTFGTSYRDGSCGIISAAYNVTDMLILVGNYTQVGCTLINLTIDNTLDVSYVVDYAEDTTRYNATLDADVAVAKIPKSLKLLGTAIVFGAVLWVIMKVIPMGTKQQTFQ